MRETLHLSLQFLRQSRITPAYAGNTHIPYQDTSQPKDHPRVCGKHIVQTGDTIESVGSPPRMRETPVSGNHQSILEWITPAYAGNTILAPEAKKIMEDHPRVCGKHYRSRLQRRDRLGSPPRMRETR